jgi:hypothetical protein
VLPSVDAGPVSTEGAVWACAIDPVSIRHTAKKTAIDLIILIYSSFFGFLEDFFNHCCPNIINIVD